MRRLTRTLRPEGRALIERHLRDYGAGRERTTRPVREAIETTYELCGSGPGCS